MAEILLIIFAYLIGSIPTGVLVANYYSGKDITREDILNMRQRILDGLASKTARFDIKHGPGGIGEVEFFTQWMQIRAASEYPKALVQSTVSAIKLLAIKRNSIR